MSERELTLENCRPIPHGGLKLVGIILFTLAMLAGWLACRLLWKTNDAHLLIMALLLGWFIWLMAFTKPSFLVEYWHRNVQGYILWVDISDVLSILPSNKRPQSCPQLLAVSLGGWMCRKELDDIYDRCYVQIIAWRLQLTNVVNDLPVVQITDRHGRNSLELELSDVIRLAHLLRHRGNYDGTSLDFTLTFLMHVQEKLENQVTSHEGLILEAIKRLGQTTRFIRSKEAEKIRTWLIEALLNSLAHDDPRRKILQEQVKPASEHSHSPPA